MTSYDRAILAQVMSLKLCSADCQLESPSVSPLSAGMVQYIVD